VKICISINVIYLKKSGDDVGGGKAYLQVRQRRGDGAMADYKGELKGP